MKIQVLGIILGVALGVSGARAQTAGTSAVTPGEPAASTGYSQPDPAKRAEAYTDFMLGHLAEQQFDDSGQPDQASQAIEYYEKALAIDQDASIMERLAEVYAASQQVDAAIKEAQATLQLDPENLEAHRLLSRIYLHSLSEMGDKQSQQNTVAQAVEQLEAVRKLDPTDLQSQLWLAHLYGFENQSDKAEGVLQGILKHSPDNESALEQLSQLYLGQGRASDAISLLQNAAGESDDPTLYDLLGKAYSQSNDYPKAEEAYQKAVELDPDEASHRRGLAEAFLAEHKYPQALEQYQKLSVMEPDAPQNYLQISQIYLRQGELDKAESSLMQAKKYAPGNLEVLYDEALVYEAQGRYKDAVQVLSDAIAGVKTEEQEGQVSPTALPILYEQLGMAYRQSGDFSTAERTFEEMQKLGPSGEKRGELLLIDTYRASGDAKRAVAEAEKAHAASPDDQTLSVTYAMILGETGQTDKAVKVLRGLLHGTAADREMYLNLAQVEQFGKRYGAAQKDAQAALGLAHDPATQETAWFMMGAIYESQKKYDKAEEMFRKSLAIVPNDPSVLNDYGYMLADRGERLDEAISMIRGALAQDPEDGAYLDSLGWAYCKQGKLTEAEKYLQRAVAHSDGDPTILGHLGEVYAKMGQTDQAKQTWEKALAQWQKALPADYDAGKVSELEAKLKDLKRRVAEKTPGGESRPQ